MNWVKSANVYEYVGYAIVIVIILIECLASCKCNYEDMISFGSKKEYILLKANETAIIQNN